MTLAGVAADQRARHEGEGEWDQVRAVIEAFEADPEFKLPERVEALAKEYDQTRSFLVSGIIPQDVARRLRELIPKGGS